MAIDIHDEDLVTLSQAAQSLPGRPSTTSLWRWYTRGVRGGIRLETVVVGNTRYTSREALQRFADRLTAASDGEPTKPRTSRQRQRDIERAEAELAKAGI